MVALTCEFCGGKLMTKANGICECEFCGMQFDKAWVKEKIQEIRGTVKVEGTVEVTGKVQIEGGVNVANMIKRGWLALEEKEWDNAQKYFEEALNMDAECPEAYLGKFCADINFPSMEAYFQSKPTQAQIENARKNKNLQNAMRFSKDTSLEQALEEAINREPERKAAFRAMLPALREKVALTKNRIAETYNYLIAVLPDGTVAVSGKPSEFVTELKTWKHIVAVAAGRAHVLGLRIDGTVVAASYVVDSINGTLDGNSYGQCDVGKWKDIVAVAAGNEHSVGLRADGTVVATGFYGENLSNWKDIIDIAAGFGYTVGLRSDGSVVAAGRLGDERCDVSEWQNIVAVAAGKAHTIGLRADGTVVAVGKNYVNECNVTQWRDIIEIAADDYRSYGLCADGRVVYTTNRTKDIKYRWENIVAISTAEDGLQGVCADGTLASTNENTKNWKLFDSLEGIKEDREKLRTQWEEYKRIVEEKRIEQERIQAQERAEKKAKLESQKKALIEEMSNLKGLFTGKRRKEIEAELKNLEQKLREI